jgi:hypothetical protein
MIQPEDWGAPCELISGYGYKPRRTDVEIHRPKFKVMDTSSYQRDGPPAEVLGGSDFCGIFAIIEVY